MCLDLTSLLVVEASTERFGGYWRFLKDFPRFID